MWHKYGLRRRAGLASPGHGVPYFSVTSRQEVSMEFSCEARGMRRASRRCQRQTGTCRNLCIPGSTSKATRTTPEPIRLRRPKSQLRESRTSDSPPTQLQRTRLTALRERRSSRTLRASPSVPVLRPRALLSLRLPSQCEPAPLIVAVQVWSQQPHGPSGSQRRGAVFFRLHVASRCICCIKVRGPTRIAFG